MEKVVRIYKTGEEPKHYEYWLTKTLQERLAALEFLRLQYIKLTNGTSHRFQRVCKIVKRTYKKKLKIFFNF